MHCSRDQDHAVASVQKQLLSLAFKHKRDRSVDAVQNLFVRVAVRCVAVPWTVGPRVAPGGLAAQSLHQLVVRTRARHAPDSKIASMKPRFLADCNVGRLARWLRALGYDASYHAHIEDAALVREAAAEDRVLLTRDRDLTKRRVIQSGAVRAILTRHDHVTATLRQVFAELGLDIEQSLTRCIECNAELEPRHADLVAARVPPFVRSTQTRYSECPGCGRIYWAGTHWQHMRDLFAGL